MLITAGVMMAVGFLVLLYSGDCLVRGALAGAFKSNVSPLLVGIIIVGFGTSLPEFMIAIQAALSDRPGLAHGNIIGSNIANVWLVLALPAIIFPVVTVAPRMRLTAAFMLLCTVAWIAVTMFVGLSPVVGAVFLAVLAIYVLIAWMFARTDRTEDTPEERKIASMSAFRMVMLILIGLVGLPLGSALLVESGVTLAKFTTMSEEVVGLTLLAVGSSLPELGAGVAAAWRKHSDVAMGNILGSNVFNILGAGGAVALVGNQQLSTQFHGYSHWAMAAAALMITLIVLVGRRVGVLTGAIFLALYAFYVTGLVQNWNFEPLKYLILERPA